MYFTQFIFIMFFFLLHHHHHKQKIHSTILVELPITLIYLLSCLGEVKGILEQIRVIVLDSEGIISTS